MGFDNLLRIMREQNALESAGLKVNEEKAKKPPIVPQQTPANKKAETTPEEIDMEDFSEQELNGPKAKAKLKGKTWKEVADKEVENPKPMTTKENRAAAAADRLQFCNECYKTFRSHECQCTHCGSSLVENVVKDAPKSTKEGKVPANDDTEEQAVKALMEGVLELAGEVDGIDMRDQEALRAAIEAGKIPEEWPIEDVMIAELSELEDLIDPDELDEYGDLQILYLKHVLVPKALSMMDEGCDEMDEESDEPESANTPEAVANAAYAGLDKLGFWHTETLETDAGLQFEFINDKNMKVVMSVGSNNA